MKPPQHMPIRVSPSEIQPASVNSAAITPPTAMEAPPITVIHALIFSGSIAPTPFPAAAGRAWRNSRAKTLTAAIVTPTVITPDMVDTGLPHKLAWPASWTVPA